MRTFLRVVLKPLSFLPAIVMMYIIFSFSEQDAQTSSDLSYKVSRKTVEIGAEILDADFQPWEIDSLATRFHGPIRKLAHMTEYFALAVTVAFPLYVYGLRGILLLIVAGMFCVAFACGDEFHQSYSAGRNPSKKDVLIDSIGIFGGIIFTRIIGWTGRKTIFRPLAKKKRKKHGDPADYYKDANMHHPYSPYPEYASDRRTNYEQIPSGYPNPMYPPSSNQYPGCQNSAPSVYPPDSVPYPYPPHPQNVYPIHADSGFPNREHDDAYYNRRNPSEKRYAAAENPDYLSEDMSLRRLMHEIRDQKKTAFSEKRAARKPRLDGQELSGIPSDTELESEVDDSDLIY